MGTMDEIMRRGSPPGTGAATATPTSPSGSGACPAWSFRQGDFTVTVLSDGYITVPGEVVTAGADPAERAPLLSRLGTSSGAVRAFANIPVIEAGDDLIILDVGGGSKYQPTEGRLIENLTASRIAPSAITKVVFTHAHPDHIWATLRGDGGLAFPNATYHVGRKEWEFWMDPDFRTSMPAALHGFAEGAQRDLGAVKDRLVLLRPGDEVVTGLRALDTSGHTPGHLSFELAGGEGLLIVVDAATNTVVSFEHPGWPFGYDTLPDLAIRNRRRLLDRAAADRPKLLGYHWRYPGVGFAERSGAAFRYVPAP